MIASLADFGRALLGVLPGVLPRLIGVFIVAFVVISLGGGMVKRRMRQHVTQMDNAVRFWARGLRYREREDNDSERVGLSWFFRFWTNFASAPSLSFFSLAVPFWMYSRAFSTGSRFQTSAGSGSMAFWFLPGLCYAGSMLLSFVVKRVFMRVRPPREGFAFGHKLKDPSFPSGHSLTSFCFWIMTALVITLSGFSIAIAVAFWLVGITIVALTGLSRVYLGVHFPSDVLGGFLMGALWCALCYAAFGNLLWKGA